MVLILTSPPQSFAFCKEKSLLCGSPDCTSFATAYISKNYLYLYILYTACIYTGLLQLVNKLILSRCNKPVKSRFVATCRLQTCYNLLKHIAASLWITSLDNPLAASRLTTYNRLVVNKLSQAMQTHPGIGLL